MLLLDDVSPIERIKLSGALRAALKSMEGEANAIRRMKLANEVRQILEKLGVFARKQAEKPAATEGQGEVRDVQAVRFYPTEQRRTKGARQKDNDAALALMDRLKAEGRQPTEQEKAVLARFSGYGGNLVDPEGKTGSPYEYYTPAPIAAGMWNILAEMGFAGGKVLDPSAGSGVFAATRPDSAVIDQVELSPLSGAINALVNDGPTASTQISPFEAVAAATPDESYDVVMTNVPFGGAEYRGTTAALDSKWQGESLEHYFILRSLDKLKPGGLAAFIVPPRIVSGRDAKMSELRYEMSMRAEFMGAYRLPTKVFKDYSDADTIADVIVLKKHGREAKAKINELAEQDLQQLKAANVLWQPFLAGQYFEGEGRRFQFGEFVAKDPAKLRDVDRVISDQSTADIAQLLRKFPGSRIDWPALDAAETAPISYRDGDVIFQDGQTLEFRDGRWLTRERTATDGAMLGLGASLGTPLKAIDEGATWEQAAEWVGYMRGRSKALDVPDWLAGLYDALNKMDVGLRAGWFSAVTAGLAVIDVTAAHARDGSFNYQATYPRLSAAIEKAAPYINKSDARLYRIHRDARTKLGAVYSRQRGFSALWKGEGQAEVDTAELTPSQAYERIKYLKGDDFGFVPLAELGASQGQDFDPFNDDEWCVSPDGASVMKADDHYFGNFADFMERSEADLAAANDVKVRDKILRQRAVALERLVMPDIERMSFNIASPYVSLQRKLEFLRDNVDPRFEIVPEMTTEGVETVNGKKEPVPTGRMIIDFPKVGTRETARERALRRYAVTYLRRGTLTTGNNADVAAANPEQEAALLAEMRELVSSTNARFNVWVKSNPRTSGEVRQKLTDPKALYFRVTEDDSPLEIPGMNLALALHGYQNAEVRRQARKFGGINGFDVGLGKTFTALASVQYAQSIGVKKKTVFVVPNSVLSNWRKEASRAYAGTDDCLFVGLDVSADGTATVSSANYARDMAVILENRHKKVFMTMEAFTSIPMREKTLDDYQWYVQSVDPSFEAKGDKRADQIRAEGKQEKLTDTGDKSAALPFFEDMGFDSIVLDEAHTSKNSKFLQHFQSAKFLSSASPSARGLDMQVKAWYVRDQSPNRDGVLALTATPITNSPLEIYGMLSLAVGEQELNQRLGIRGADEFMEAFSDVQQMDELDLIGRPRSGRVFLGLNNVQLLRNALGQVANIKSADDVGKAVQLPEEEPVTTRVELSPDAGKRLIGYQQVYAAARAMLDDSALPEQVALVQRFSEMTGESVDLLAHPFNLINKMSNLIMDEDLEQGGTFYAFGADQKALAEKAVAQFNAKKITEKRTRPGRLTDPANVTVRKKKSAGEESEATETLIKVQAKIEDGRIVIDTTDYGTQGRFLEIAEKLKLDLDQRVSPKLAALLGNVKQELANPKATGGLAKQIIFCDMLGMHHKIKRLLTKRCGVPASKIAIINAQAVSDPADMQDIQDGFNADGDENRYQIIIANKKAEVGINLQKGTQAIHHLSIGWTPDSLTQRNGRGVRQGNYLSRVTVYQYDASGTFDEYKRTLVGKKDDWISNVMGKNGEADNVRISGGLSDKEMHDLIMASGDETAMQKARANIARREREQQTAAAREAQVQTLRVIEGQQAWLARFKTASEWRHTKMEEHARLVEQASDLGEKLTRVKREDVIARVNSQLADVRGRIAELEELLKGATLDRSGNPAAGLGYYVTNYGRDKGAVRSDGKVNPDSVLVTRYQEERASVEQALEQARREYKSMAKRSGGAYTEDTLAAFEDGSAQIVAGTLVRQGMIARHKSQLWVVADTDTLILPADGSQMSVKAAVSGFEFVGPADADEDWLPVAEQCVALDEAKIAATPEGFGLNDKRLFSTFSPDIAARLKTIPPSLAYDTYSLRLKAPHYPVPVHPDNYAGEVARAVVAEQAEVLDWVVVDGLYGRKENRVRLKRITDGEPNTASHNTSELMVRFAIARNLRLSADDVAPLNGNLHSVREYLKTHHPDFAAGFEAALSSAVEDAKTRADLDAWLRRYAGQALPFVAFDDERLSPESLLDYSAKASLKAAQTRIATGGKATYWLEQLAQETAVKVPIKAWIVEQLAAKPADLLNDDGSIKMTTDLNLMVLALVRGAPFEGIEGAYRISEAVRAMAAENYSEDLAPASVMLCRDIAPLLLSSYDREPLARLQAAAGLALTAKASGGMDVQPLLDALTAVDGIGEVTVITRPVQRPKKPWHGPYNYLPGTAVTVRIPRGSSLSDRLSDKSSGIEGRYFDRDTSSWVFTLKENQTDTAGKRVASVFDLMSFVSLDPSPFRTPS